MKRTTLITLFIGCWSVASFAQTEFSQDSALQILKHLSVDIGPRPMGSPAVRAALQFAVEKFREYGCDTAYVMPMEFTERVNTNGGIAVGIERGATKRMIVIGGHMDSAGPEISGADDDGSGSATVIEAARVFGRRQMQSTLVFCCFDGEEQGLEGSRYFVENFQDIDSVALMLQVDMADGHGVLNIDPDMHDASAPTWLVGATVDAFNKLGYSGLVYPTHFFSLNYARGGAAGSDHESFLQHGIPAIDFTTDVDYPIHTPRDNFENFDPSGLKRTGDLIVKLVERFDNGTPSRQLQQYWLYLVAGIPIFVPLWGLWIFLIVTITIAIVALVAVWKRRPPTENVERIKWSGLKVFLFSIIIVACGWFSSNLIGVLHGLRYPWYSHIDAYVFFAAIAMMIGGWMVLHLGARLRLAKNPFGFFLRAVSIVGVFTILLGMLNLKLTVEPMVALLLVSCEILIRAPALKLLLVLLSPWWMWRVIFSEWSSLFIRGFAGEVTLPFPRWILSVVLIALLSVYFLPFLYAVIAVVKDSEKLRTLPRKLKSPWVFIMIVVLFVGYASYLLSIPVYNQFWYRNVGINQSYDLNTHIKQVSLRGSEYLTDLALNHGGRDTTIDALTTFAQLNPAGGFDTDWVHVNRRVTREQLADTTLFNVKLVLSMRQRPYTVTINYSGPKEGIRGFDTPFKFRMAGSGYRIAWYSFPDSILNIPVSFRTIGNDSISERIEVLFDSLAYPMEYNRGLTDFIPRTTYSASYVYKK